jgi:hypothetical protein
VPYVRRYLPDGSLDAGFGVDGDVVLPGATCNGSCLEGSVGIRPDGGVTVVLPDAGAWKVDPTGVVDPSYAPVLPNTPSPPTDVAPDGSLSVVDTPVVHRWDPDGVAIPDMGVPFANARAHISVDEDGRIAIAARPDGEDGVITRVAADGTVDLEVPDGVWVHPGAEYSALEVAADGTIVAAGLQAEANQVVLTVLPP